MARRPAKEMPAGPTKSELAFWIQYYSTRAIGAAYGVGCTTVRRWCQDFGLVIPRRKEVA